MHLFEPEIGKLNFAPCAPRPLRIETPLGVVGSCAIVNGEPLAEAGASFFSLPSGAWVARWELECGALEVLASRPAPGIEAGHLVPVHGCQAFLWRFVAARAFESLTFEARRMEGFGWKEGGPSSGQYLDAQSWDDRRTEVSLGTEGDDALFERSRRGDWLPQRYAQHSADYEFLALNRYFERGLAIDFDAALPGESFAAHYAVAWADVVEGSVATWLAVDTDAAHILSGARQSTAG